MVEALAGVGEHEQPPQAERRRQAGQRQQNPAQAQLSQEREVCDWKEATGRSWVLERTNQ